MVTDTEQFRRVLLILCSRLNMHLADNSVEIAVTP